MRQGLVFSIIVMLNISCFADTFVVDLSGNGDFLTIQSAIDAAFSGDTIIVSPGSYVENIYIGGKDIVLTSTDPEDPITVAATIINGGGGSSVITFSGNETSACSLSGFTITRGDAHHGGGIQGNGTKAAISYCIIQNNYADWHGGGITGADGDINRCIISSNSTNSYGGGLSFCNGKITNCLISKNSSKYWGGGIEECNGFIGNCTIVSNLSGRSCGGVRDCKGVITNCIIWGNQHDELFRSSPPTYSCIEKGYDGEGNIDSDPCFVDPNSGDYYLLPKSLCIDTGDPNYMTEANEKDLDGNPRLVGSAVDMGCYEFVPSIETIEVDAKLTPQVLNRKSSQPYVIGRLELAGFSEVDLDLDEPMVLMPGDIAAERVEILPGKNGTDSVTLTGFFDHAALMEAIDGELHGQAELDRATRGALPEGELEVTLAAKLLTGQWVYGTDTVRVK